MSIFSRQMYHFMVEVCLYTNVKVPLGTKLFLKVARPKEFQLLWGVPLWNFDFRMDFGGTADTFCCFDLGESWWFSKWAHGRAFNGITGAAALNVRFLLWPGSAFSKHRASSKDRPIRLRKKCWPADRIWMYVHRGSGTTQTMLQTIACQTFWVMKKTTPIKLYACQTQWVCGCGALHVIRFEWCSACSLLKQKKGKATGPQFSSALHVREPSRWRSAVAFPNIQDWYVSSLSLNISQPVQHLLFWGYHSGYRLKILNPSEPINQPVSNDIFLWVHRGLTHSHENGGLRLRRCISFALGTGWNGEWCGCSWLML